MTSRRFVDLIDFTWSRDRDPRVPLGHASLLAALDDVEGLRVTSHVVPVNDGPPQIDALIAAIVASGHDRSAADHDVAMGVYVWGERWVQQALRLLRQSGFRGRIILGGPQISYADARLEQLYPEADVFVRGAGEVALRALARAPGRSAIRGVHYAGEVDRVEQTPGELASLPSPILTGTVPLTAGLVRWETQRGCPYLCSFCQHRTLGGERPIPIDDARLSAEIVRLVEAEVPEIAVLDPTFNFGPRATGILRTFRRLSYRGRLTLQCRAELIDEPFLDAAAGLDVCIELGIQSIHPLETRATARYNDLTKIARALAGIRARGIDHLATLIFGLPYQTLRSFEASVTWCLAQRIPIIRAFPLMLLRGTGLEQERAKWGLVDTGGEMPVVVASDTFSAEEGVRMDEISQALRRTEGHHPASLTELLAHSVAADAGRWRPLAHAESVL